MDSVRRLRLPNYQYHFGSSNQMVKWSGGPPFLSFAARQEARAPLAARAAEYAVIMVIRIIIFIIL